MLPLPLEAMDKRSAHDVVFVGPFVQEQIHQSINSNEALAFLTLLRSRSRRQLVAKLMERNAVTHLKKGHTFTTEADSQPGYSERARVFFYRLANSVLNWSHSMSYLFVFSSLSWKEYSFSLETTHLGPRALGVMRLQ